MTPEFVIFLLLSAAIGFTAVMTVTARNLIHAAIFLAVTLAGIGAVFLVLHADFLALVQVVVYVGAIAVLFLFGLMLTRAPVGREALDSRNRSLALGVSSALFVVLAGLIVHSFGDAPALPVTGPGIAELGEAIFSVWVFPFELASMLLLAALVGAILLARREAGGSGEEAPFTRLEVGEPPALEPAPGAAEETGGTGGDERAPVSEGRP